MKKFLFLILLISLVADSYSQKKRAKAEKSVYAMYARQFRTHYVKDSGQGNLVGRKNWYSLEMGLNMDYKLGEKWDIRTGISCNLFFIGEITYGTIGPVPYPLENNYGRNVRKYSKGIEYIQVVKIGFPVKGRYNFYNSKKYSYFISGGPFMGIYFPASNEMAGNTILLNSSQVIRQYELTRYYRNHKTSKSLGISYPQLEGDLDIEARRKFKKYGAVTLGFKLHLGTKRLERAEYVVYPYETGYRSKGHVVLNRSYYGIYGAFTFGKH